MSQRKRRDREHGQHRMLAEDHEAMARLFEAAGAKTAAVIHRRRAAYHRAQMGGQ